MLLIEGCDNGLGEEIGEEDSLWYRVVAQRNASSVGKCCVATAFYHVEAFLCTQKQFVRELSRLRCGGDRYCGRTISFSSHPGACTPGPFHQAAVDSLSMARPVSTRDRHLGKCSCRP